MQADATPPPSMLPTRQSSSRRFREYLRARKDKARVKGEREQDKDRRGKSLKRSRGFFELLSRFWGFTREHRPVIIMALAILTLTTGVGLIIPAATKVAIDYVLTDNPGPTGLPPGVKEWMGVTDAQIAGWATPAGRTHLLWWIGGVVVALSALAVVLGTTARWQVTRVTKRVQTSMRRLAFEHAVDLPLHRVQHYKAGGMSSLLREDAGLAGELLFSMIYNPWRAIVQLLGTLAILAWTDWCLLLGGLLIVPAVWVTHKTWIARIRPLYRDSKEMRQQIDASTTEAFGGLRVVRGFGRSRAEASRFVGGQHTMTRIEMLTWWWSRIVEIAWSVLIPIASAAVLVYGGSRVLRGDVTLGDLMMFSTYLLLLLGPLETLTATAAAIQSNLAAFDRVLNLMEEAREFDADEATLRPLARERVRGEVELRGVSFAYPKAQHTGRSAKAGQPDSSSGQETLAVLHEIDLHVRAGQTIALVGPSGAGKTTLCNLVARFYDPTHGTVLLDGSDLRTVRVRDYRGQLGIVEQDVFLFDGSIAENIAYGRRDATPAQVIAAAKAAYAHEFIEELEQGYATLIGERGVRLSGGQKQRIAIARGILADPKILILDEATSNLDTHSEQLIQKSLGELMKGRTCFVIAHRLSTIRSADRIVVMSEGRIVESGTHEELMGRDQGLYAYLVRLQTEGAKR